MPAKSALKKIPLKKNTLEKIPRRGRPTHRKNNLKPPQLKGVEGVAEGDDLKGVTPRNLEVSILMILLEVFFFGRVLSMYSRGCFLRVFP